MNKIVYKTIFRHLWFHTIPWKYRFEIFFQVLNILILFFSFRGGFLFCAACLFSNHCRPIKDEAPTSQDDIAKGGEKRKENGAL